MDALALLTSRFLALRARFEPTLCSSVSSVPRVVNSQKLYHKAHRGHIYDTRADVKCFF